MKLRPATGDDVAAVAALEHRLFGVDAWSSLTVAEELTSGRRDAVVATRDDEQLVGYTVTLMAGDVVDLLRIAVHPDHRRQGVAHALLTEVLDRAAGAGAERVLLEVSAANLGAVAFYAAEGFAEVDRRRRYYRDGSDALVLGRSTVTQADDGG